MPQEQANPLPLHIAASLVHQQLSGSQDESQDRVLDSTALALSHIADIYYINAHGQRLKLPEEELAVGMFEHGGRIFRTRSGNVYESLSVRRVDVAHAIAILKEPRA